jgi:hypothetical protein
MSLKWSQVIIGMVSPVSLMYAKESSRHRGHLAVIFLRPEAYRVSRHSTRSPMALSFIGGPF